MRREETKERGNRRRGNELEGWDADLVGNLLNLVIT